MTDTNKENGWLSSQIHKPPFNIPVWGWFKDKHVEIVILALTEKEYSNYFEYTDSSWYSLESEKTGSVTHWQLMKKPWYQK